MKEWGSVPATTMAGLQLSGLASGLDWKSLVDQLMEIEATPITRLEREQANNNLQATALKDLATRLTTLQTAAQKLKEPTLFNGRTITPGTTGTTWKFSASAGTPTGSHTIDVTQLATKTRREGVANITSGLAATSDVSGVTLATMRTASVVTAGKFTVNGAQVTVATTDSLQSVFAAIATATGGDVTAAYDPVTDKVTLAGPDDEEIVLGAANDTSNFLQVLKLTNNGTDTIASYGTLGTARTGNVLASAGLSTAITAVDGTGAGTFSINGVSIDYNVNTDSLAALMKRINASAAGVTAAYDAVNDRMTLTNNATGDLGVSFSEATGGVLAALGLDTGATTVRGENAEFSIDGGPTLISTSNTLDSAMLGVTGLSVTVDTVASQTVSVAADTAKMRASIDSFVTAYNAVQLYIDEKTKISTVNGKVTTSVLTSNREVQDWARQMRGLAFGSIAGVGGIDRLDDLGLDLDQDGRLSIEDGSKLDAALANQGSDVEAFFTTATTGFAAKFDLRLDRLIDTDNDTQERLAQTNSRIDLQIADLERRLAQRRELLTSSFIAMESAQSNIQRQSAAIANAFGTSSSSK
jgi:flagellar hook-associated protein 2